MNSYKWEGTGSYNVLSHIGCFRVNRQCKIDMTFFILFCFLFNDTEDTLRKQRQKGLCPPTASGRINFNKGWENVAFDLI